MWIEDPKNWKVGAQIADMHYGFRQIEQVAKIRGEIRFSLLKGTETAFLDWLQKTVEPRIYTNKMLVLVEAPSYDDFWTAAYCYDGVYAGFIKLKPTKD